MGYVYSDVAQERKHLQDPGNLTEVTVGNQENMVERLTKANVAQSIQTLKKETRGGRRRGQRRNSGSRAQAKSQRLSHHHPLPQSCRRQGWRQILNARIMKVIGRNSRGRRNRRRRRSREGRYPMIGQWGVAVMTLYHHEHTVFSQGQSTPHVCPIVQSYNKDSR